MPIITPGFREFLPSWIASQPWYTGPATPALRPAGFIRYEDPAGEVGMETHLLTDGSTTYHVPLTYRGSPLPERHRDYCRDPERRCRNRSRRGDRGRTPLGRRAWATGICVRRP